MKNTDPKAIGNHLQATLEDRPTHQELAFDPATGELSLVAPNQRPADAVVIDQIAEDGFFQPRRS